MTWTAGPSTTRTQGYDNYRAALASSGAPTISITALPYARTVAMGSITITGTTTNTPTSITWSASPSGASGTVTGDLTNWSTSVAISPDASGEGIETITFTATNAGGSDEDSVTVGFYVSGAHSWFNAQNINGSYNSGMVNNDSIATWENLGSSGTDITQSTGSLQPTYITSLGGISQPFVSFDGADVIDADDAAANWSFMHQSNNCTVCIVAIHDVTTASNLVNTMTSSSSANGSIYGRLATNLRAVTYIRHGSTTLFSNTSGGSYSSGVIQMWQYVKSYTGTAYNVKFYRDLAAAVDSTGSAVSAATNDPLNALKIGTSFTGKIFTVAIYQSALSSTQTTINANVTEWALSGTLPITP